MLSWEAITAIATALSAIVVAATVALSVRQIRLASDQLQHLRKSTQLEGTMQMMHTLTREEMVASIRFINGELPAKMHDPAFRASLLAPGTANSEDRRHLIAMRTYEQLGGYIKHGLLDGDIFYDIASPPILETWNSLVTAGVIALHREQLGVGMWENYELLVTRAKAYVDRHGPDYITLSRAASENGTDAAARAVRS